MIRMTVLCILFLCIQDGISGGECNSGLAHWRLGLQSLLNELQAIKALLMEIKNLQPTQSSNDTKQDVTGVTEVQECDQATDLVSGISDSDITASTSYSGQEPFDCRLNTSKSWGPSSIQTGEYLQFDFTTSRTFVGISTEGSSAGYYVSNYGVSFSSDCQTYSNVSQSFGGISSEAVHTINLTTPILARCIRISPTTWYITIELKVGLLGC